MYEEHREFCPPPDNATLWRYMDFTKFVSLLDRQALFFSRIDKLGDPFEGSSPLINVATRPTYLIMSGLDPKHIPDAMASFANRKQMVHRILVNCWHENNGESEAMWKLYGGNLGLAIKTTFAGLSECFECKTEMFIGKINYIDYNTTLVGERNLFTSILTKRKSFEHEREVRVVANDFDHKYEFGTNFDVNLDSLVDSVVIAPYSPEWFVNLVKSVANKYSLKAPISISSMDTNPVW